MERVISKHSKTVSKFQVHVRDWPTETATISSPDHSIDDTVWCMDIIFPGSNPDGREIDVTVSLKYKSERICLASHSIQVIGVTKSPTANSSTIACASFENPKKFVAGGETTWSHTLVTHPMCQIDGETTERYDSLIFELVLLLYGDRECIIPLQLTSAEIKAPSLGEQLKLMAFEQPMGTAYADITLVAGSARLACHRCILSARSSVFKKKFQSRYFGVRVLLAQGDYAIDGMDPEVLKLLVAFIYSDEAT